jgi:hypothetical protein
MRKISPKSGQVRFMSALAEASHLLRVVAGPYPAGDKAKTAQDRAWRRLKTWSRNRVEDIWKARPRVSVSAEELEQLRRIAREREAEDARAVVREAREIIARLEQCLRLSHPQLDREELGEVFGVARGPDSAVGD